MALLRFLRFPAEPDCDGAPFLVLRATASKESKQVTRAYCWAYFSTEAAKEDESPLKGAIRTVEKVR
jgi:hypothetical protein